MPKSTEKQKSQKRTQNTKDTKGTKSTKKHHKAQKRNQAKAQNANKQTEFKNALKKHLSGKVTYSLICVFALAKKKSLQWKCWSH